MNVIRWLVHKDLARFFADRNGALLTFIIPMALAALLGSLFGQDDKATAVELLVVDRDESAETQSLVKALEADETLDVTVTTEEDARAKVEKGDAAVAIVLPPGAGKALNPLAMFTGTPLPAQLLHDPSKKVEADLCSGLVTKILMQEVGKKLGDSTYLNGMLTQIQAMLLITSRGDPDTQRWIQVLNDASALMNAPEEEESTAPSPLGGGMQPPLKLEKEAVTAAGPSAGYNSYAHSFAGMLCMFLLFWALDAGKESFAERKSGALMRVRMSPATRGQALVARALSVVLIALLMSAAVYALGFLVFGIEILGSVPGFLLVIISQAFFIGGMTLLLIGVAKSERQMINIGSFAVLIMSFLGGAWMPSFILPEWVQGLAQALPTHWSTEGLAAMTWRGLSFESALLPSGVLVLQGVLCATIGWLTYRWES